MPKKKSMLVASIMIVIGMTLLPAPSVFGYVAEEVLLGSEVDPTTFTWGSHTIAEGFAADITMDLPVPQASPTQTKVGFAVAGLSDTWEESGPGYWVKWTPYVSEMWLKVEGDYDYTVYPGSIYDNTGSGPPSVDFLSAILLGLDIAFLAYDIYSLLQDVYQDPQVQDWQHDGHWAKAIVSQKTELAGAPPVFPFVDPNDPRLQTAGANVLNYFEVDGLPTLTITAQAEICLQAWDVLEGWVFHYPIGTYSVDFQVSVPVGVYSLQVDTYLMDDTYIVDVPVWVDDSAIAGGSPVDVSVGYGTHTVKIESVFYRSIYEYTFDHWEGGSTSNPKTVGVYSDMMLRAYYARERIGNTPPVASNPHISPSNPVTTDSLDVDYAYSDADDDPEADPQIRWYRDGVLQPGYNDQDPLPSSATAAGDVWYFTVRPNDGIEFGDEVTSPSVTIVTTHDVAVTDIALSKTIVGQGYNVEMNVTVINQGDFSETFGVWLYLHIWPNYFGQVTLGPGEALVLTYTWNTTAYSYGDYTISAFAEPVSGETDTVDNSLIDGSVLVTIPGDVDGDHDVDIYDIVAMQSAYGTHEGDPNYDPNYDIDGDGDVDIYDVVKATGNYGQFW